MGTGIHHGHAEFGFQHDAFGLHHGLGVGVTLGFLPFFGPWNGYAYPYYGDPYAYRDPYARDAPSNQADTLQRADTVPAGDTQVAVSGRVAVPGPSGTDSLIVESVAPPGERATPILRVTWEPMGRQAEEVALFVADSSQAILAVQTVRGPPFAALFEPPGETVFAGITVVWPTGSKSTRLIAIPGLRR